MPVSSARPTVALPPAQGLPPSSASAPPQPACPPRFLHGHGAPHRRSRPQGLIRGAESRGPPRRAVPGGGPGYQHDSPPTGPGDYQTLADARLLRKGRNLASDGHSSKRPVRPWAGAVTAPPEAIPRELPLQRRESMCQHQPRCPEMAPHRTTSQATDSNRSAPGQGPGRPCSANGVIEFDDGGELLPDGPRPVTPDRRGMFPAPAANRRLSLSDEPDVHW